MKRIAQQCGVVLVLAALMACSKSGPTAPSTPSRAAVTLTVSSITVTRTAGGYEYGFTVTARETAGIAATLNTMTATIFDATAGRGTATITSPFTNTSLNGNGTQVSRSITLSETSSNPIAAVRLNVAVIFTDAVGGGLNAAVDADITPLPPLPTSFTLSGTVSIAAPSSSTRLAGAFVQIVGGPHAGKSATTDGAGAFSIPGLSGDVSARASMGGYLDQSLNASMTQNRTLSFGLLPPPAEIDETLSGGISGGTSTTCSDGVFTKPCVTFTFPVYYNGNLSAELNWGFSGNDLDLTLWRGTTLIASSRGVSRPELVSSTVSGGNSYSLKVTYYDGATIESFSLRVKRPK